MLVPYTVALLRRASDRGKSGRWAEVEFQFPFTADSAFFPLPGGSLQLPMLLYTYDFLLLNTLPFLLLLSSSLFSPIPTVPLPIQLSLSPYLDVSPSWSVPFPSFNPAVLPLS